MTTKKTIAIRAPRDIVRKLEMKLPGYDNATRIRLLWDTSAIKLDDWLGRPIKLSKKK